MYLNFTQMDQVLVPAALKLLVKRRTYKYKIHSYGQQEVQHVPYIYDQTDEVERRGEGGGASHSRVVSTDIDNFSIERRTAWSGVRRRS